MTPAKDRLHAQTDLEFEPGSRIGGYVIDRLIGVGGMADVYLARHKKLEKQVAIKVLQAHSRDRSDLRARFLREGQAASRIRNSNVVEIFDVGIEDDVPYLVMQYLPGPTLEEHMANHGLLSDEEAAAIFLPIAAAVAAGHEEGVIHRDLKPENVILVKDGGRVRPVVLDFGVSRLVTSDPAITMDSSVIGTPHYMSPEQARGEKIDSRTDQYALGVMLYEAVTGRLPRDRPSVLELLNEVGHKGFDPPSQHRPSLSPGMEAVILKMMEADRRDRFAMVLDVAAALLPFAKESVRHFWMETLGINPVHIEPLASSEGDALKLRSEPAPPKLYSVPPSQRPEAPSSRRWVPIAAVLLFLLVGGGVYAWISSGDGAVEADASEVLDPVPASESYVARVRVEPAAAQVHIDGELMGTGEVISRFEQDGTRHELRVSAPGFEPRVLHFQDVPPPSTVTLTALSDEPSEPSATEPSEIDEEADPAPVVSAEEPARRRPGRRPRPEPAGADDPAPTDVDSPTPSATPGAEPRAADPRWEPRATPTDNLDPWAR